MNQQVIKTSAVESGLKDLIASFESLQKNFMEQAQSALKVEFAKFFELYPEINVIQWTQYTPYFNDGDECTFRVNDIYTGFVKEDSLDDISDYGEFEGHLENGWTNSSWSTKYIVESMREYDPDITVARANEVAEACVQLNKLVGGDAMEDVCRAVFGDHVRVRATKDGFDIQEYEHE